MTAEKSFPHRIYVAGPMTGYANHNLEAFSRARHALRVAGFDVVCPGELSVPGLQQGIENRDHYMRLDFTELLTVEGTVFLPGWTASRGANAEALVTWELGLPGFSLIWKDDTLDEFDLVPLDLTPERMPYSTDTDDDRAKESILQIADRIVDGARRDAYGHPLDDYTRTGKMLSGLFGTMLKPGVEFLAEHVPMIVECIKLSREFHSPKKGNRIDGGGYWKVMDLIHEERARRVLAERKAK